MQEGDAIDRRWLAAWCIRELGAEPIRVEFEAAHLSRVVGLELSSGRRIVVKVREPSDRLVACCAVQRSLWSQGFPCPEPLVGPIRHDGKVVTAEALIDGGEPLPSTQRAPHLFAAALARLVRLAPAAGSLPTLWPPPPWVWWDHAEDGAWPPPDDLDCDLNSVAEPEWLTDIAQRVRRRLLAWTEHPVVGHADWYSENLRWVGERLHAVYDWDSVAALPEAALAGAAAAIFTSASQPGGEATLEQTDQFLASYADARGRRWTTSEYEVCWAAGLWTRAFDAKKETVTQGAGPIGERLRAEAAERLRRIGAI
jgi:hypothetical protein